MKIKVIKLKSDNFDCLVTQKVYKSLRLQMSTGDFHTHKAKKVYVKSLKNVLDYSTYIEDMFWNIQGNCQACGK